MKTYAVIPGTKIYRMVRRLFLEAFPAEERRPFWSLWLLSVVKRAVQLQAYKRENLFCGFSLTVCTQTYLYISFLAVPPEVRSQGCGAQILNILRKQYGKPILVEIEVPEDGTPNQEQRLRRKNFYLRNGFQSLNREIVGRGIHFELMSTEATYDREAYSEIFPHLSFGIMPRLKRLFHNNASER